MSSIASVTPYQVSAPVLVKVSAMAFAVAIVILVLFVLPAERGIDLTGLGKRIGLTQMARGEDTVDDTPKAKSSSEVAAYAVPAQTKESIVKTTPFRSDEKEITIAPHEGLEIKAHMKTGDHFIYTWTASAPVKAATSALASAPMNIAPAKANVPSLARWMPPCHIHASPPIATASTNR